MDATTLITIITMFIVTDTSSEFVKYDGLMDCLKEKRAIEKLKDGEKIILIRHALAPGSGDPINFDLNDCTTQRNLNIEGVEQSKKIGTFFNKNNIPIDQVLSSEWCRCKDTAKYAFEKYKTFYALNSFFSEKFKKIGKVK